MELESIVTNLFTGGKHLDFSSLIFYLKGNSYAGYAGYAGYAMVTREFFNGFKVIFLVSGEEEVAKDLLYLCVECNTVCFAFGCVYT